MSINFISSKNSDETCNVHRKSNNIETMVGNETVEVIEEIFKTVLQRYQKELEDLMKESEFIFDSVN